MAYEDFIWFDVKGQYTSPVASVIVYREGDYAVAKVWNEQYGRWSRIAKSTDHASVIQTAIDNAEQHGIIVLHGEFTIDKSITISKALTIYGGKLIRDTSVGSSAHNFFTVGGGVGESIINGPAIVRGVYFDGNERNITSTYTEAAGAPVHTGITIRKIDKVIIENCTFVDMAREAIWIKTVENTSGVIDHEEIIIKNNYFENVAYGITAESYKKVVVVGNIVKGINSNGDPSANRSYFFSPNYLDCIETVISNNVIDGEVPSGYPYAGSYGRSAVNFGGGLTIENIVISKNTMKNLQIAIENPKKSTIAENTISDVVIGISLYVSNDTIVIGNQIRRFTSRGISVTGTSTSYAERNMIISNIIDTEDQTADYGIYVWSYVYYNVVAGNIVKGNYNSSDVAVWSDYNLCDAIQLSSTAFNNLSTNISDFPYKYPLVPMIYYDGAYYYLAVADPANKALRKVQLS